MIWITLLVLGTCLPACLGDQPAMEVSLEVDLSASHGHVGDNLTVVCRVTDMLEDGYIYWFRTIMSVGPEEYIDLIALSTAPMPPYNQFPRYRFDHAQTGNTQYFTMNIYNVTKEETGHIGCSYRELEDNVFESENYEVFLNYHWQTVRINEVEVNHNDGILVDEGQQAVAIEVGDSIPAAHLTMYIGDEDVSEEFTVSRFTDIQCTEGGVGKTCALHYTRRSRAESSFVFTGDHDGKNLTVTSIVPDSGFEATNKTYPITVRYAPMFRCQTHWSARFGVDFTLSCAVKSNPKPDVFYWNFEIGKQEVYVNPENYVSQGTYDAKIEHVEGACIVSLTLYNIGQKHLGYYDLVVGNELNNNTLNMMLMQDTSPTSGSGTGAAGRAVADIFVVMAAMFAVLRMCYFQ